MKLAGRHGGAFIAGLLIGSTLLCSCQSTRFCGPFGDAGGNWRGNRAVIGSVQSLARNIDALETHIDKYGSVTIKQPDVWGQARLTRIRDEYESQMALELGTFKPTLQGSAFAADQAYFANAFALSMAASGTGAIVRSPVAAPTSNTTINAGQTGSQTQSAQGSQASQSSQGAGTPLQPMALPSMGDLQSTFGAFGNVTRNAATLPTPLGFGPNAAIALEPTVVLEQKSRYLQCLHELRRIEEGDDTADAPGYSLNLVRIPVSVLPGRSTDCGWGAEVTLTITPLISEELLPTTFRSLVLNDIVDQVGYPITQFINNPDNNVYFNDDARLELARLFRFLDDYTFSQISAMPDLMTRFKNLWSTPVLQSVFARREWSGARAFQKAIIDWEKYIAENPPNEGSNTAREAMSITPREAMSMLDQSDTESAKRLTQFDEDLRAPAKTFHQAMTTALTGPSLVPATKSRRARLPFPGSQMLDIYGYDFTVDIIQGAYTALRDERSSYPWAGSTAIYIHLPDVQGYLQEQLAAARDFLEQPSAAALLNRYATQELVIAIRNNQVQAIREMRRAFREEFESVVDEKDGSRTASAALVWATIVESALMTDQLVRDMREVARSKGYAGTESYWLDFASPNPSPEARQAFNEYVRIRWPIHVFALDPVQQQQNIAASFSGRREMQLAMSMAFVSGRINAQDMMRYARRVEFDAQTIDLNGTTVGFSHGNETFGWRFYPRFQVPEIKSNMSVFFQDLLIGGPTRNQLLSQRRLEPGMRECDAIVIMPSFVPYATIETSSNWFKLCNPMKKVLNSEAAMCLSRQARVIENCVMGTSDCDLYRGGDVALLSNKAKQLEARLPMQTMSVQVPYENTLGGFAMFNTGVTDLAPELTGWYGAPTINTKSATTVFLVGNHFSVRQTSVIAGGNALASSQVQLLSRQVVQVTIPANPLLYGSGDQKFVDVNIATPYGVTQHLLIPAYTPAGAVPSGPGTDWVQSAILLAFAYDSLGIAAPTGPSDPKSRPANLLIQSTEVDPANYDSVSVTLNLDDALNPAQGSLQIGTFAYDSNVGAYVVSGDQIATLVLQSLGASFGPQPFPPSSTTASARLTFHSSKGLEDVSTKTDSKLTINWVEAAAKSAGK